MPRLKLLLRPELDEGAVRTALAERLEGRYAIEDAEVIPKRPTAGFVVVQSEWVAAAVRVRQKSDSTSVAINGIVPSLWRRVLVVAPILLFVLPGALSILYFFYFQPRDLVKQVSAEIEQLFEGVAPASAG